MAEAGRRIQNKRDKLLYVLSSSENSRSKKSKASNLTPVKGLNFKKKIDGRWNVTKNSKRAFYTVSMILTFIRPNLILNVTCMTVTTFTGKLAIKTSTINRPLKLRLSIDHQILDNPNYVDSTIPIESSLEDRTVTRLFPNQVNDLINNVLDQVHQTLCTNLWNCTTSVEHITKDKDRPNSLFTLRSPAPDNTQFVYMELHRNNSTHVGKRRHVETDLSPLTSPRSRSPDDLGSGLMGLHNINNTHTRRQRHKDICSIPPTTQKSLSPVDTQFWSVELHHIT